METAKKTAKDAHERSFGKRPSVMTGLKSDKNTVRPFIISAIGVGQAEVNPTTRETFGKIAKAGGGTYGTLLTADKGGVESVGDRMVEQILKLSFGEGWTRAVEAFLATYREYRAAGRHVLAGRSHE